MNELEDFIIMSPYSPTEKEQQAINELSEGGLTVEAWNSMKDGIKSFKTNLIDDLYYKQNCRCAYCRIELPNACCFLQREHIVPKALHPQWMFHPLNLCFSCDRCNNFKLDTEVLSNPNPGIQQFPSCSSDFKIINPYLDKYSEHIELLNDIIYRGKSLKGKFTIDTCHLYRIELAIERAKQKISEDNKDSIISDLLTLVASGQDKGVTLETAKTKVKKLVEYYNQVRR